MVQKINLICSVVFYKNQFLIGKNGRLLVKIPQDLEYFKKLTTGNVVLMGRKTWDSLLSEPLAKPSQKPLPKRVNIVLTNNETLIKQNQVKFTQQTVDTVDDSVPFFMTFETFNGFYTRFNMNVFVIGGGAVFDKFLSMHPEDPTYIHLAPHNFYLTEIKGYFKPGGGTFGNRTCSEPVKYSSFKTIPEHLRLVSTSARYTYSGSDIHCHDGSSVVYRFLKYSTSDIPFTEEKLLTNLMESIIWKGTPRSDRTNTGTLSVFGRQLRLDISDVIPVLTTRFIPIGVIVKELLWFLRGDTDAKVLQREGVHIWDGHTSRQFLDSCGLTEYPAGILGAGYGFCWRNFGGEYKHELADTRATNNAGLVGGFDQLAYIIHLLKTDPFSRRIMLSSWCPIYFHQTALIPCHTHVQFYVHETSDKVKHLSCQFYMRSNDVALALDFNVVSYTVLTYILALKCDMVPSEIIYTCGDAHIYKNHIEQVKLQLTRDRRPLPMLVLNPEVKTKKFEDIQASDFELVGYFPHPAIAMEMAI